MVSPPPTGARLLAARYRLERPLARGAMGELWVARDETLDRPVAVKLISTALGDGELVRTRFQREARAAARLRSPHVVPVFDHGEDGGVSYIVMELLEGEGLDARLRRIGRCSLGEVVWLTEQICRGLTVAHEAGVIHRDLKPANLFLAESAGEETVKVLDFGIAKLAGFDGSTTMTGELVGSPFYMSPEQAEGTVELDPRSDLWALGVILYLALTGRVVFDAPSLALVLDRIRSAPIPPPSAFAPELPPAVDAFFTRALARPLEARFASARELALAFAEAADAVAEPLATERSEPPTPARGDADPTLVMPRDRPSVPGSSAPGATIQDGPTRGSPSPEVHDRAAAREAPRPPGPSPASDGPAESAGLARHQGSPHHRASEIPPTDAEGARTHRGVARAVEEALFGGPPPSVTLRRQRRQRRLVAATVVTTAAIASVVAFAALRAGDSEPAQGSGAGARDRPSTPTNAALDAPPASTSERPEGSAEPADGAERQASSDREPRGEEPREDEPAGDEAQRSEPQGSERQGSEPPDNTGRPGVAASRPAAPPTKTAPPPAPPAPKQGAPKRLELGY